MQIKTVALDDDVAKKVTEFQEYMNKDSRLPISYSKAVNFLLDLALKDYGTEGGENKQ